MKKYKDITKGVLIGVIITVLSFTMIFAAPVKKSIEVIFNDVKIAVDGRVIVAKDTTGNTIDSFSYNGTIYFPVRSLCEAMSKQVTFDVKTNTVYIGTIIKPNGTIIGLGDMVAVTKNKMNTQILWEQDKKLKIKGIEYESRDAMTCTGIAANGSSSISYVTEGKYTKINGLFGVDDSSPNPLSKRISDAGAVLQVIGDGNVLYETNIATKGEEPIKIDADIIGVNQLTIKIQDSNKSSEFRYRYDFLNVKLTKSAQ